MTYLRRIRTTNLFPLLLLGLLALWPAPALAQVSNEARREAARLERLARNVWEGLLEEHRFGSPVDSKTRLDVFNFYNGALAFRRAMERSRTRTRNLADVMELLQLQSEEVDRTMANANIDRLLVREWEDTKMSLDSLARLLNLKESPPPVPPSESPSGPPPEVNRERENVNELRVAINQVKPTGNFLKSEFRVRGTISGRNLVSAGIYAGGQLLKSLTVPLHSRNMSETPFSFRMKSQDEITIRVIDSQGLLVEEPVKFPSGGVFPGLR